MKDTAPAIPHLFARDGFYSAITRIGYVSLIFLSIQVMNQFLILSGATIEKHLPGIISARLTVGVYQEVFQAFAGIVIFRLIFKKGIRELGINTKNHEISIRYLGFFALAWLSIIVLYVAVVSSFFPEIWASMTAIALPQTNSIVATLLFQAFFPGFGEEILFRGLIVSLLASLVFPRHREHKASMMGLVGLSSLYFATAHIYFSLAPFQLTHIDSQQLMVALGCGAFYTVVYLKTKSLLAPFLAHNFSNLTATICGYIISTM